MKYIKYNKPVYTEIGAVFNPKTGKNLEEEGVLGGLFSGERLPQVKIFADNLSVNFHNITGLDISKNEVSCVIQFSSKDITFEESGTIAYQGDSTLHHPKKGFSINLDNKKRFKNWLLFDEFNLKGYYTDWTHTRDIVCNRILEDVYKTSSYARPFMQFNNFTDDETYKLIENDGFCHIDGFACELYINDTYWGLYTLNLKKKVGNYFLNKKDVNHIQLETCNDARLYISGFDWRKFEIRCPKDKITNADGTKYDGDNPQEIADGAVKTSILNFITGVGNINASSTREYIEQYINIPVFIDWYLFIWFVLDADILGKNTLFTTWDGQHWSFLLYDMDLTFGIHSWLYADVQYAYNDNPLTAGDRLHCAPWIPDVANIYATEINNRYAELREKGVFTLENIKKHFDSVTQEIGADAYKKDLDLWNNVTHPTSGVVGYACYGKSDKHFIFTPKKVFDWMELRIAFLDNKFDYNN